MRSLSRGVSAPAREMSKAGRVLGHLPAISCNVCGRFCFTLAFLSSLSFPSLIPHHSQFGIRNAPVFIAHVCQMDKI